MKKIGVVTFFKNNNYGSVLQCYALQQKLREYGYEAVVLNQVEGGFVWKIKKAIRLLDVVGSAIRYPARLKQIIESRDESKRSCKELSKITIDKFDGFVEDKIKYENVSYKRIKKSNEYAGFISGSDQVWGTSGYFLNPFMFLDFADQSKRFSYAASFGADVCPDWYKKKIKKYLSKYKFISVRENTGSEFLRALGLNSKIHIDPTLLLTKQDWKKLEYRYSEDDFLFLYFLNEPSDDAIKHVNMLIDKLNIKRAISTPYDFEQYKKVQIKVEENNLSPEEFLGVVDGAKMICTDSFHGAAFSIVFEKPFYSYYRQYTHSSPQNNRIETLLEHFGITSRLIKDCESFDSIDYQRVREVLIKDRVVAEEYISMILEEMK